MTETVVIYVNGGPPQVQHGTGQRGQSRGPLPEGFPHAAHAAALRRGRRLDPHAVHREFPERWMGYIRACYRDYNEVCQAFGVCERTARKWWSGETGANGGHVAVAMRQHPEEAARMLFADAA